MRFRFDSTTICVNMPDVETVLAEVDRRLQIGQGFSLATINLDHLVKLRRSEAFRHAYAEQDLVVADGNPVVWLSRLARKPVALVPGADLVMPLIGCAARAGVSVALVGSTDAALARAADRMERQVPGAKVVARIAPPMGFDPESEAAGAVIDGVIASGARLCLLALGAPKQEILAARGRRVAPEVGFVSVGAGLDFIAGTQSRAPESVRRLALEWLWRLIAEPRRMLSRYAACAAILPAETLAAIAQRSKT